MTEEICPVSGFSKDQQERWSHLHALLTQEVDTLHALNHPDLPRLGTEIQASLQQATMSSEELTHRKAVFRQLKKRIEFEFEGSQLHAFGSTESGTSLGAGDLDLCIVVKQQSPRRLLNKIRNVLKQMGMKDIEVIGRAKRYYEAHSGLEVVAMEGFGATDAYAIGALDESHALAAFKQINSPEIEALVVPGGNFPTMRHIAGWEERFGKPVITTNQVVLWSVMKSMGVQKPIEGLGRLLSDLP